MGNRELVTSYQPALPGMQQHVPTPSHAILAQRRRSHAIVAPASDKLRDLRDKVEALAAQEYAGSYVRKLASTAVRFVNWAEARGHLLLPPDPLVAMEYLVELSSRVRYYTLRNNLAGIDYYFKTEGYDGVSDEPKIRRFLRELRCRQPSLEATLLTAADVAKVVGTLGDAPLDRRDRALILISFTGALDTGRLRMLDRSQVTFHEDSVELVWKGERFIIGAGANPSTDPIAAVRNWLAHVGTTPGALFCKISRGEYGDAPLSVATMCEIVQRAAKKAGFDTYTGGLRTLRRSMIVAAAQAGIRSAHIMRQTGLQDLESLVNVTGTIGLPYELRSELTQQKLRWGRGA